jgi:hypothetical protein
LNANKRKNEIIKRKMGKDQILGRIDSTFPAEIYNWRRYINKLKSSQHF